MKKLNSLWMIALFLCVIHVPVCADENVNERSFITMSIPKSGTHLIGKLIGTLSSKPKYSLLKEPGTRNNQQYLHFPPRQNLDLNYFLKRYPRVEGQCLMSHFTSSYLLFPFLKKHPEYVCIINIRDLRDICVALTFALAGEMSQHMHPDLTFDQRLSYIIQGFENTYYEGTIWSVTLNAKEAVKWMQDPKTVVVRFENLVGVKGGGSNELQEQEIMKVANALNVPVSPEWMEEIKAHIWGKSPTFRKGKTGEWRRYFKPEHIVEAKKHLGKLLIELGYEKDYNW